MNHHYSQSFKAQAVKKVLNRPAGLSIRAVAENLSVSLSALKSWLKLARQQQLEVDSLESIKSMAVEKKPHQWSLEERLEMIIACAALDESGISSLCRKKGIYPHHVKQWKKEFAEGKAKSESSQLTKKQEQSFKTEIKSLKKALNRKEKALAETAALLVLQKKVNQLWSGEDEDV